MLELIASRMQPSHFYNVINELRKRVSTLEKKLNPLAEDDWTIESCWPMIEFLMPTDTKISRERWPPRLVATAAETELQQPVIFAIHQNRVGRIAVNAIITKRTHRKRGSTFISR